VIAAARRPLTHGLIGAVGTVVAIAFRVFLIRQGLDRADKIASIISMVVSLVIGIWGLWQARRARRRREETSSAAPQGASGEHAAAAMPGPKYNVNIKDTVVAGVGDDLYIDARGARVPSRSEPSDGKPWGRTRQAGQRRRDQEQSGQ